MSLKELQDRKLTLAAQMREIGQKFDQTELRWADAETEGAWRQVNADYDAVVENIAKAQEAAAVAERMATLASETANERRSGHDRPPEDNAPKPGDSGLAFRAWLRGGASNEAEAQACRRTGLNASSRSIEFAPTRGTQTEPCWNVRGRNNLEDRAAGIERRAAQTITTSGGGYTVPSSTFIARLDRAMLAFGGIRQAATVMRTDSGSPIEMPTVNDTSNQGRWLSINTQVTNTAWAVGQVTMTSWLASSDVILLPIQLLDDAAIDVEGMTADLLGERIGRLTAAAYAVGDDSGKPNGIVTASTAGKTTASATAFTGDELFDFVHSVDPAYRMSPSCGWAFHDNVLLAARKLKDGNSNYLFQPGLSLGEPDRLLGYPYTVCNDMDSTINTASKIAIFGDLSKYLIRDVGNIRVMRLVERYADYHQVGLLAFMRTDGELVNAGTAPVKHLLTA